MLLEAVRSDASQRMRYRSALALGYLGDRRLVVELVGALGEAKSAPVRAALTRVIGEIGDRSALETLIGIAKNTEEDRLTRMRAIAALGLVGESADPTWTESLKRGANRAHATPTLRTALSIF